MSHLFTVQQFRDFIDYEKVTASYLVKLDNPTVLMDDMDTINERFCDDVVEGGSLLNCISFAFEVKEGEVYLRVDCDDAGDWIAEHRTDEKCPECGYCMDEVEDSNESPNVEFKVWHCANCGTTEKN